MSLSTPDRQALLDLARHSVRGSAADAEPMLPPLDALPPPLQALRASFVTLRMNGELRGCIGSLTAVLPLAHDVVTRAHGAAYRDPRFKPVTAEELDALDYHIAVLSPPTPLAFRSEAELLSLLVPGRDGLILRRGGARGTFLPAVWESLPEPDRYLRELKAKAGIAPGCHDYEALVYQTEAFP